MSTRPGIPATTPDEVYCHISALIDVYWLLYLYPKLIHLLMSLIPLGNENVLSLYRYLATHIS